MKTAKEFFKEEYSEHNSMAHYPPSENRIAEIMELYAKYYHEQQVNSVDLADVVGRIEQLCNCDFFIKQGYKHSILETKANKCNDCNKPIT